MSRNESAPARLPNRKMVLATVLFGTIISVATSYLVKGLADGRTRAQFLREADSLTTALERATESSLTEIDSLAAFFRASEKVDPDEFEQFVKRILQEHRGIRALEWIPRIPHSERTAFETTSWDGHSDPIQIIEGVADQQSSSVPATTRPQYFPAYYVQPRDDLNTRVVGFDLGSERNRRITLEAAAEENTRKATIPLKLGQSRVGAASSAEKLGIIVVNPIYNADPIPLSPEERKDALKGYVTGVFLIPDLVDDAVANLRPPWMSISVSDITDRDNPVSLHNMQVKGETFPSGISPRQLQIMGRAWSLHFEPEESYFRSQRIPAPWSILVGGLLLTTILGVSVASTIRQAGRAFRAESETLAAIRSRESALEEAMLLEKITQKITEGVQIEEILDYIYTGFDEIIPYDRLGLALVESDTLMVRSLWSRARTKEMKLSTGFTVPLKGSSLMQIYQSGSPRIIDDLFSYSTVNPDSTSTRLILEDGIRSSLTCPIQIEGKVIGFLFFSSMKPNQYNQSHVATFMRVARNVSVIFQVGTLLDTLAEEQKRTDQILASLLPGNILRRIKNGERRIVDEMKNVAVIFADIVGFSERAQQVSPQELVDLLNKVFEQFDLQATRLGVDKIGIQGDCYLAVAGISNHHHDPARPAAEFALSLRQTIANFHQSAGGPLSLRIGIHTGPVVAGVIGKRALRYDVWGNTVNLASRMESLGEPNRVQVSAETANLLQPDYRLTKREPIIAKGFGTVQTYWLEGTCANAASQGPGP